MHIQPNTNTEIKGIIVQDKKKQMYYYTPVLRDNVCFTGGIQKNTTGFLTKLKNLVSKFDTKSKLEEEAKISTQKVQQTTAKIIEQTKLPFSRKNVNISITKNKDGEMLNFSTNTKNIKDYRTYSQDGTTKVFYEKSSDVTAIYLPYGKKSITIQVDGQLTKEDAKNLIKYLNLRGFPDERYFLDGTVDYLNK